MRFPDIGVGERLLWRRVDVSRVGIISGLGRAGYQDEGGCIPVGSLHSVEDGVDKSPGHLLVKEVAHRVDEDTSWLSPI